MTTYYMIEPEQSNQFKYVVVASDMWGGYILRNRVVLRTTDETAATKVLAELMKSARNV